ncbi:AlkZ-related protein [Paenibacillus lactis]
MVHSLDLIISVLNSRSYSLKIPFAAFIPDYPSLTAAADHNDWHSGSGTDPWLWRIRIVQEGVAAYGKFFSDKACFIQTEVLSRQVV